MDDALTDAEVRRAKDGRRTETLIQHPETGDFLRGALVEAAYQREAWPDQDAAKEDPDWFWTAGYLLGKALKADDDNKRLHQIEAAAGLLANWHRAVKKRMAPPEPEFPEFTRVPCQRCGSDVVVRNGALAPFWSHLDQPIDYTHRPEIPVTS